MFTDVFLPLTAQAIQYDRVRAQVRPDGTKLKAQMWFVPHNLTPEEYAEMAYENILAKRPGVLELNIEPTYEPGSIRYEANGNYAKYLAAVVAPFRAKAGWTQNFPLRFNVPPFKASNLPISQIKADPYLYAAEQSYYGDMSRVSESEALLDLLDAGVPKAKASICYGAISPDKDGVRRLTLPTVYYQQHVARKLRRGMVFTDDLLAEQGLI